MLFPQTTSWLSPQDVEKRKAAVYIQKVYRGLASRLRPKPLSFTLEEYQTKLQKAAIRIQARQRGRTIRQGRLGNPLQQELQGDICKENKEVEVLQANSTNVEQGHQVTLLKVGKRSLKMEVDAMPHWLRELVKACHFSQSTYQINLLLLLVAHYSQALPFFLYLRTHVSHCPTFASLWPLHRPFANF